MAPMGYRRTHKSAQQKPIILGSMNQANQKQFRVLLKLCICFFILSLSSKIFAFSTKAYFSETALRQADNPDLSWSLEQRDCAGFVRYVYARTFKTKDALWVNRWGKKSHYLRAEELISFNFNPILKLKYDEFSYGGLDTGDVLVYYNPTKSPSEAWHLMLILFPVDRKVNEPLIIYHNGAMDTTASVRKIWWRQLFDSQWTQWRPDGKNPFFRGFYRWRGFTSRTFQREF